jgi:hypothetical protein
MGDVAPGVGPDHLPRLPNWAATSGAGASDPDTEAAVGTAVSGPSTIGQLLEPAAAVVEFLNRRALIRATRAIPRTLHFVGNTLWRGEVSESLPAPHLSVGLAAQVAIDEALLAVAMAPNRFPLPGEYSRVAGELAEAEAMFTREGWVADPPTYHRTPPTLTAHDVTTSHGWALGLGYDRITWESDFAPREGEPGAERWMGFEPNKTATAALLRHGDPTRPWVIAVHGFCMGFPFMDFPGLHAGRLHKDLGMNVALPALPLHGMRRVTRISGEPFLSFELMNAVHGLTQAIWDIRRLISWVRAQGATSISLFGVSLGAYTVSLLAGIEPGLDGVVAGIPVADFPGLFHQHSPRHIRVRAIEHRIMGGTAENVYRVVSPLCFEPLVPRDRRYIFAGYGDRLATPDQARRLAEHWGGPPVSWYAGNHVGYLWSRKVTEFVEASLAEAGGLAVPGSEAA